MKNTKLYVVMMFAAMQTSLVLSMGPSKDAHQAILAYAPFAQAEREAFHAFVDSSLAESSQTKTNYELRRAQEMQAREELLRKYPQYVSYQGEVLVHIDGGYAVTGMRVGKYLESQKKSRPFQLAARVAAREIK